VAVAVAVAGWQTTQTTFFFFFSEIRNLNINLTLQNIKNPQKHHKMAFFDPFIIDFIGTTMFRPWKTTMRPRFVDFTIFY
jgi:hypothetical protein